MARYFLFDLPPTVGLFSFGGQSVWGGVSFNHHERKGGIVFIDENNRVYSQPLVGGNYTNLLMGLKRGDYNCDIKAIGVDVRPIEPFFEKGLPVRFVYTVPLHYWINARKEWGAYQFDTNGLLIDQLRNITVHTSEIIYPRNPGVMALSFIYAVMVKTNLLSIRFA